jgi:hypothetical protein
MTYFILIAGLFFFICFPILTLRIMASGLILCVLYGAMNH